MNSPEKHQTNDIQPEDIKFLNLFKKLKQIVQQRQYVGFDLCYAEGSDTWYVSITTGELLIKDFVTKDYRDPCDAIDVAISKLVAHSSNT